MTEGTAAFAVTRSRLSGLAFARSLGGGAEAGW